MDEVAMSAVNWDAVGAIGTILGLLAYIFVQWARFKAPTIQVLRSVKLLLRSALSGMLTGAIFGISFVGLAVWGESDPQRAFRIMLILFFFPGAVGGLAGNLERARSWGLKFGVGLSLFAFAANLVMQLMNVSGHQVIRGWDWLGVAISLPVAGCLWGWSGGAVGGFISALLDPDAR